MGRVIQVQTTTQPVEVTYEQLEWLKTTGRMADMSNYPQAPPCFPESAERLHGLLNTMPRKNPGSQVDPEDPEGSLVDGGQPEPPATEETVIVSLLREQNSLLREQKELLRQQEELRKKVINQLSKVALGLLNLMHE